MIYNPRKIRPRRDWVLVLMDLRKTTTGGGIHLPETETGAEKVTEGMATLIRVGPGEKNLALKIEAGQRVAIRSYLKFVNPIETDERWVGNGKDLGPKEYFLMASDDLMGILEKGVDVGVFSHPEVTMSGELYGGQR